MLTENIYGHAKRLEWLLRWLQPGDTAVELGCGTGYMISLPLARAGFDVVGIDLDQASIDYGRNLFQEAGLPPSRLMTVNLADLDLNPDTIIASEVFEHIPDTELHPILDLLRRKLKPGGLLLVTVPNGYGWFELESFLWFRLGLGTLLTWLQFVRIVSAVKSRLVGPVFDYPHPSTVANSPHVQRFTYGSIARLVRDHGFEVIEETGSVLFAGPFSNLCFTGVGFVMQFNRWLGRRLPRVASGFYLACRLPEDGRAEAK